jgi:hypothetical protein
VVTTGNGRVFVCDPSARRVWLLDGELSNPRLVLDSVAGNDSSFANGSTLLPFRGDSALLFDRRSGSLVVVGSDGRLGRTFVAPEFRPAATAGLMPIVASFSTTHPIPLWSDSLGLIYRVGKSRAPLPRPPAGGADTSDISQDSVYLARYDADRRQPDTVAVLSIGTSVWRTMTPSGAASGDVAPLFPFFDRATVAADGSIALLRAREYRIHWLEVNGARSISQRLPYSWQAITPEERRHILDSANTARRAVYEDLLAEWTAAAAAPGGPPTRVIAGPPGDGRMPVVVPMRPPRPPVPYSDADVPDYRPPVGQRAMMADADNNIWIHPNHPDADPQGTIWQVFDRSGKLVYRVRVPSGMTILAFGSGGVAYIAGRDAGTSFLQKVRIR